MKLPHIHTKHPIFIVSGLLATLFLIINFIPNNLWNNLSGTQKQATAFTANISGNWNVPATWGKIPISNYFSGLGLVYPQDVAVKANGEIYVANTDAYNIKVLNSNGTASTTYSTLGRPYGITFAPSGEIYLSQRDSGQIEILNPDGTSSTTISGVGAPQELKFSPTGSGEIYILSFWDSTIYVLNPDHAASTSFSTGLARPRGFTISSTTGEIFVANEQTSIITVLNSDGTASTTYSAGFYEPFGIEFSPTGSGELYIADRLNNRIVVLNPGGTASTTYTGISLNHPHGLTFSPSGEMFVSNIYGGTGSGHIKRFRNTYIEGTDYPGTNDNTTINNSVSLSQTQNVQTVTIGSGGTLNLAGYTLNFSGGWWQFINAGGTFTPSGGSINFTSSSTDISSDATINYGTVTLTQDAYVNNLTLASGGTLDLNGYNLYVAGNWNNDGGALISNGGTVNFIGTSTQIISGENTFYNLTKTTATSSIIVFDALATTTITNNFTLTGSVNNLLTISGTSTSPFVSKFGEAGSGNGQFSNPYGIAVSSSGDIYVVDVGNNRIQKFNSSGEYQSQFGTAGSGDGEFAYPYGIAISSSGDIYIADTSNNRIQKFNSLGVYQSQFGIFGSGDGEFAYPYGIAISSSGDIYIADTSNNRIQKFNSLGVYQSQFGTAGSGDAQFSNPQGIAISSSGDIYVADTYNSRIQKFDSLGVFQYVIGSMGNANGEFVGPMGIAIDSSGDIYVEDTFNHRIQEFTSSEVFKYLFGSEGTANGKFSYPQGITIDSSDNIYVVDTGNNRIQKFSQFLPSQFKILKTGSGSATFEYLNVSGSNNISLESFSCLLGCINGGNNTNWIFPTVAVRRPRYTETTIVATTTATTTIDVTPPVITILGDNPSNITLGETYKEYGATAFDNIDGNITSKIVVDSSKVNTSATGTYFVSYTVRDVAGNIASSTRMVSTQSFTQNDLEEQLEKPNQSNIDYCFEQNIERYSKEQDTIMLKLFLEEQGYMIGDNEYESLKYSGADFYGHITTELVAKFQEKYASSILVPLGLSTGTGIFGNYTRKAVNDILGCPTVFEVIEEEPKKEEATTTEKIIEEEIILEEPTPEPIIEEKPTEVVPTPEPITETKQSTPVETPNLIMGLTDILSQSYDQVSVLLKDGIARLGQIMKDPAVSLGAKMIATGSLVLGVSSAIGAIAFANPLSFSEIWLIPGRLSGLVLGALGIRRKNRPWGTVYDSVTKRPLDPAYVSLLDITTGKEVAGAITDIDGRYSFLTMPGVYKIVASKTNYTFPSTKLTGAFDEVYNDLYHGTEVTITVPGEVITKNIPLDPQKFDWNEFAKTNMNVNTFTKASDITWAKISKTVFVIGFAISVLAVYFAPQPYNFIITGVYMAAYLLNYVVLKPKTSGTLTDNLTKLPLAFAIVKVFREGETEPMLKKIADKDGKYFILLPKGNYSIQIEKKNLDASYTQVYKSDPILFEKGIINLSLAV